MFCRIYVTAPNIDRNRLLTSLCELQKTALVNNAYIEINGCFIEVRSNDEYDPKKAAGFPDGFLFFPFCIEIDIPDPIPVFDIAYEVGKMLTFLWKSNVTAIASCDFEDLLPENGGYCSKKIPWEKNYGQ